MKSPSKSFAGATRIDGPLDGGPLISDLRRMMPPIHGDLVPIGLPRVNLLLTGVDGVIQNILESILLNLQTPIASWEPGERLVLPPAAATGTLILHGVDAMSPEDQFRLLEWSEQAAGRTQVISTAPASLLPLVHAGIFNEMLYYRLNIVFIDATAPYQN